jgi:flagellar hook-associated protein 2
MSDIYIPGLKSRFSSEKVIEDLMKLERVPKDRAEKNIERFETEKSYWQEIGTRTNSLKESARQLFSFQNPFSDRRVTSGDESILSAVAVREAGEQDISFTVKQIASSDRFLSSPLAEDFKVESGTYTFTIGDDEISFDFRGGSLKDFTEALNRRGHGNLQASLISVKSGSKSLLIESKVTGEENRLGFSGTALSLGELT